MFLHLHSSTGDDDVSRRVAKTNRTKLIFFHCCNSYSLYKNIIFFKMFRMTSGLNVAITIFCRGSQNIIYERCFFLFARRLQRIWIYVIFVTLKVTE